MDSVALWFEDENEHDERITRRILRDRSDILSLNDHGFIQNFRLNKDAFMYVLNAIKHDLNVPNRSTAIPTPIKVAAALKLLGQGGYQHQIGQDHLLGLSQQSMSRCLQEVCMVIERILCPKHIQFEVTAEEENEIKRGFFHACGIPGVIGAVDGTHIQMIRPARNEHLYFNRKLKHSMNAMVALPKVPVPPLDQTMTDYVRALEPITTPAQLERTKAIIKQFSAPTGLGPRLHQHLTDKRDAEDNWAYYYWLNDMYMDVRLSLPINSNPGMVFPPRRFATVHDVARFAARILDGILMHKEMLDTDKLQQERAASREKNQPLCMAQYYRLLGSCRRPGVERDSQYLPQRKSVNEHVIIMCRNQMYCVVLKAQDRGKLSESEIASQILYCISDAQCLSAKPPPLGLLTAEPRSQWAEDRATLQLEERNQRNIDLLETALIVLALDEPLPLTFNARGFTGATPSEHFAGPRDETNMAHEMLHGGGSEYNSGNRWFDKTMQIIICTDGSWGLCYEHSTSEGIAVVQLLEKIYKNIVDNPTDDNGVPQHHLPPPERLDWDIAPEIQRRFGQAAITFDRSIDNLDFYVYRYRGYGKNFIKACQVSPDVYIQLSLQLAYYKLYGHLVATYESASTRRFLLGRVDCIRSASTEALDWAKAMCQGEGANVALESDREEEEDSRKVKFSIYSKDHLRELFRCAVARQTEVMVQNILGNGIDIPLLGLREASREVTGELHELFTDESYKISQCFLLSTSQVASTTNSFMGYGPVTPKGYGCSYNPHPEEIIFCVSAFYACEDTSASRYAKSLQDSLDIMRDLLQN